MIQAKDLRIVNYYRWSEISSLGRRIDYIRNGADIDRCIELRDPIPLTEDVLRKCGFDVNNNTILLTCEASILFKNGIGYFYSSKTSPCFRIQIQYFHQLQNIYHALTGEELTIEL